MIAGSGNHDVFICDECIELCSEILEEELGKQEEEEVEEEAPLFNEMCIRDRIVAVGFISVKICLASSFSSGEACSDFDRKIVPASRIWFS